MTSALERISFGNAQANQRDVLQKEGQRKEEEKTAVGLPFWVWAATIAFAIWGAFSPNPLITPVAIILLTTCIRLLWRRGEPPILVFAVGMQWLQAAGAIFYANSYGLSLTATWGGPQLEQATWLSLAAIGVLSLAMRLALVGCKRSRHASLVRDGSRVNIVNAFIAYAISAVIAGIVGIVAWQYPNIAQEIYALATIKWVAVFILSYCVLEQRTGYIFLLLAILMELATGFIGYFANFKSVFFVLVVAAMTSLLALKGRRLFLISAMALLLFALGVVWTAIKTDYREFLNQGSGEQEIVVSAEESFTGLANLVSNLSWDHVTNGLDAMILRVSYVNYFALTIINVPDKMPYENGALWGGALKHIVTPRVFFPEKAAISDSDRSVLYTGAQVSGEAQGTSIGIGYVAESYVDFGPVGMFAPIFLLGVFYGLIYRTFVLHSRYALLGSAIAAAILIFGAYTIETSNIKIVGGNVTVLIVMTLFFKFFGRPLWSFLTSSSASHH